MAAKSSNTSERRPWYLRPYVIGLILAVAASLYFLLLPLASNGYLSWNPGNLHTAHKVLNNNCQSCHQNAFEKVQDSACMQCHQMQQHAELSHPHKQIALKSEGSCIDCHFEHSGHTGLIQKDNRLCIDCHKDLATAVSNTQLANVSSLQEHPKFSVSHTINGKLNRSVIGTGAVDQNTLKLNHALHLKKDLRGPDGPQQLQCVDCHSFEDKKSAGSIKTTFEKNCRSCHQLTFDESLPDSVVPHGKEELILPHLLLEYAKLSGQNSQQLTNQIESLRSIPGKSVKDLKSDPAFVKILKQSREAEELLFTKTSCNLCHEVKTADSGLDNLESKYKITKPAIPQPWLKAAYFPHQSHAIESCESCHKQVTESKQTSDIMLPQIDNCQQCHVDSTHSLSEKADQVESNCITCHNYHDQKQLTEQQKKNLEPLVQQIKKNPRNGS